MTRAANFLVVVESVTGLVVTALATGIVFVRFSRVRSKIRFVKRVAISPDQGVPNLTVRIGNERRAPIVDVSFRMTLIRTITTQEGVTMYRSENLKLVHDQTPILTSATLLRHVIDPESPMVADTPDTFAAADVELVVAVRGTDETSLQPVHARKNWSFKNLVWGARLSDVITETTPTDIVLDLRRFDDLEPSDPTPDFPYRADPETLRS